LFIKRKKQEKKTLTTITYLKRYETTVIMVKFRVS